MLDIILHRSAVNVDVSTFVGVERQPISAGSREHAHSDSFINDLDDLCSETPEVSSCALRNAEDDL